MAGADEPQQKRVLDRVLTVLKGITLTSTPPEIGDQVHRIVRQVARQVDPYQDIKAHSTRQALQLYPRLKAMVAASGDPWMTAVRLSIAGNIIDLGPGQPFDLEQTIDRVLAAPFAIDDSVALQRALSTARSVLYLADNAGETVFDRLLIEVLGPVVTYAVKGGPIINDATRQDALDAGLDRVAEIVSTGSDAPGTILDRCSAQFRALYESAPVVIAKGQANYETLSTAGPKMFFLLQAKCPVIAGDLNVPVRSIVLKQG